MKIYLAKYQDSMYPEDNCSLGLFWKYEDAETAIKARIESYRNPLYPNLNLCKEHYYDIEEFEICLPEDE